MQKEEDMQSVAAFFRTPPIRMGKDQFVSPFSKVGLIESPTINQTQEYCIETPQISFMKAEYIEDAQFICRKCDTNLISAKFVTKEVQFEL